MTAPAFDWDVVDTLSSTGASDFTDTKTLKEFLTTFCSTDPADFAESKSVSKLFFVLQTAISYLTGLIKRYQREKAEIQQSLEEAENCQSCPTCEKRFRSFKYLDKHFEKCHLDLCDHWRALRTNRGEARKYTLIKGDTLIIHPLDSGKKYVPTDVEVIEATPIKKSSVRPRRHSERKPEPLKTYGNGLVFMTSDRDSERMEEHRLKKMTDLATYHLVRDMQKLTRNYVERSPESGNGEETKRRETPPKRRETPPRSSETLSAGHETPPKRRETPPKRRETPPKRRETPPKKRETPPKKRETPPKSPETPPKQIRSPRSPRSPKTPPKEIEEHHESDLVEAHEEQPEQIPDEITNAELDRLIPQSSEIDEQKPAQRARRRRHRRSRNKAITEETLNEIEKEAQRQEPEAEVHAEEEEKKEPPTKPTLVFRLKPAIRKVSDDEVPVHPKPKQKRQIRKEDTFHDLDGSEMVDPFLLASSSIMEPPRKRLGGVNITNSELDILLASSSDEK